MVAILYRRDKKDIVFYPGQPPICYRYSIVLIAVLLPEVSEFAVAPILPPQKRLIPITMATQLQQICRNPYHAFKQRTAAIAGTLAIGLNLLWIYPVAADPFRTTSPRQIGAKTEAAFDALFKQGNYREAAQLLQSAEPNEPLTYALRASLAYVDQDFNIMGENARLTLATAQKLVETDPLRGNMYTAVGHFLEGAHTLSTEGTVRATPTVLTKLQQVFDHLRQAEAIDPNDPELNLIKGYMDLMLAVNLPFSDPQQAIQRLQSNASPGYLAQRGIAIGYRDLEKPDEALVAVDRALQETPDNPELFYLKAQILRLQSGQLEGNAQQQSRRESVREFRKAWEKRAQLPASIVNQLNREYCRTFHEFRGWNPDGCQDSWQPPARPGV
jgi:tetratricopeptide (TPR) repeat protein